MFSTAFLVVCLLVLICGAGYAIAAIDHNIPEDR